MKEKIKDPLIDLGAKSYKLIIEIDFGRQTLE